MKKEINIVDLVRILEQKMYDENLSEHKRNIAKSQLEILGLMMKQNISEEV